MSEFARRCRAALVISLLCAGAGVAQTEPGTADPAPASPVLAAPVVLDARQVTVDQTGRLIAEGDVVIRTQGRVLRAPRIVYDQSTDRLLIDGPIQLSEGPDTLIYADAADLDAQMRDGIVTGIRLVLDQQIQIAAAEAQRQQGRFTDLRQAVATSCEVCQPGEPPLWQLQARRVIHDEERERIYFQDARFLILNVPVFYIPALSTPEPGVRRASGFLVPTSRASDLVGTGPKVPIFFVLDPHTDVTLTPYVATDLAGSYTRTLELRFRQAVANGTYRLDGAASNDSLVDRGNRGYLFAEGRFDLPHQTKLSFGLQTVSDDAYLSDYDYSSQDRLRSFVDAYRVQEDSRASADISAFRTLRQDEDNDTQPVFVGNAQFDRRFALPRQLGFVDTQLQARAHQRPSQDNRIGRDSAHTRGLVRWSNARTVGPGLRFSGDARVTGDVKLIQQDEDFDTLQADVNPGAALTASLPLSRTEADGTVQYLEPMAQLVWTSRYDIDSPNDDSTQPGLDAGNLLGFQRFPGVDRVEDGPRANLATRWNRIDPDGLSLGVTVGRVLRFSDRTVFSAGTGLARTRSDWLAQIDADLKDQLSLRSVTLVSDKFEATLNETRVIYTNDQLSLGAGYVWQVADVDLGQDTELSEVTLDGLYDFNDSWSAALDLRRDLIRNRTVRAEMGLTYRNECIRVDLSGTRRFRNTEGAEPTITYGLTVSFTGFGTGDAPQRRVGKCAG